MIKDTGCQYHSNCLTCPFVLCVFEYPGGPDSYFGQQAMKDALDSGMSRAETAEKLGITVQSVHRRIKSRTLAMGSE